MLKLSNTVNQIIASRNIQYFFLVTIESASPIFGTRRYTSNPYDITMDDTFTYTSNNTLLSVDPPKLSNTVDRASYTLSFSDTEFLFKSYFEEGATGDAVTVRLGFINSLDVTLDGITPGNYFPQITNSVLVYKGVIDGQKYQLELDEESSAVVQIECSSPMADLNLVKPFFTSKESMRQKNSNDTSFDSNYQGSGQIKLKWGKR
jgi:hypothetical protein